MSRSTVWWLLVEWWWLALVGVCLWYWLTVGWWMVSESSDDRRRRDPARAPHRPPPLGHLRAPTRVPEPGLTEASDGGSPMSTRYVPAVTAAVRKAPEAVFEIGPADMTDLGAKLVEIGIDIFLAELLGDPGPEAPPESRRNITVGELAAAAGLLTETGEWA